MNYEETVAKLQSLRNHGSRFGIDRMRELDAALGAPSRAFPAIHVAGTNGKGSTCAMIEAVQRAHGRTTGLYTSPHLVRLGERVQINRRALSERAILAYCEELFPVAESQGRRDPELAPSFFEFMTAMAFLSFAREPVEVAVVEVGLGGRLDATNILEKPLVTVITSIGFDHMDLLGDTLGKIAAEKAGILKPGVPLALGLVPPEAEAVIRARAAQLGVVVHSVRERYRFSPEAGIDLPEPPETNLSGDHQRANAALALLACELASGALPFDEATARRALTRVDWSARWQTFELSDRRRLILDVAHNEEGARALESNLARLAREGAPIHAVVGVLGLDRAAPLLAGVARHAASITLVRPDNERACTLEELSACVPSGFPGTVRQGRLEEIFPSKGVCAHGEPGSVVVVAGSVYLAGEVLARFAEEKVCDEYARLQDRLPGRP